MAAKKKAKKGKASAGKRGGKATRKPAKKAASKRARPAATPAAPPNPWKAFAQEYAQESAITAKVMRAYPADQPGFQPHPRSSSAMKLFATFVGEQGMALEAVKGTLTMPPKFPSPPATLSDAIVAFEKAVAGVVAAINAAKPADWNKPVPFFSGPGQLANFPAGALARFMLADQIHHRGQLSVYVRMAGGKVPSIYGPSADEPWM